MTENKTTVEGKAGIKAVAQQWAAAYARYRGFL